MTPFVAGHLLGGALWRVTTPDEEHIVYAVAYNHRKVLRPGWDAVIVVYMHVVYAVAYYHRNVLCAGWHAVLVAVGLWGLDLHPPSNSGSLKDCTISAHYLMFTQARSLVKTF